MRVLAVDPGYDRIGIAVLERAGGREELRYSDCFTTDRAHAFAERLLSIGTELERVIAEHRPGALAIETLLFNTNQKTAMGVAQVRGLTLFLASRHGLRPFEYSPQQIKVAVTGYGKSDKAQVTAMVERLVALPHKRRHDDEYDAIAAGLTCLACER